MRMGIYGGTFNPVHLGHIRILREFISRLELDRVLMTPANVPPHKSAENLADGADRLNMCALAVKEYGLPVEVSSIELDRQGKSYTVDTLEELRRICPEDEFFLLMGEDMFLTVDTWRRAEDIMKLACLCSSPRSGDGLRRLTEKAEELKERYGAVCAVEDIPYFPASSTEIRELLAKGESAAALIPESVERYILEKGLYKLPASYEEYEAEVKKYLTPERFYHSRCVAETAARLAEKYGGDPEKARLAGILHDIMKDTPKDEQLKIMESFGIILTKTQRSNPKLWHSLCGAAWLRYRLGVEDEELLSAVSCHTSGKKDMSLLEKILFTADYISADRDYPGVEVMRDAAERSLEEAMVKGIAWTFNDLTSQGLPIDPDSVYAYNDALEILRSGEELNFTPGRFGFPEIEKK